MIIVKYLLIMLFLINSSNDNYWGIYNSSSSLVLVTKDLLFYDKKTKFYFPPLHAHSGKTVYTWPLYMSCIHAQCIRRHVIQSRCSYHVYIFCAFARYCRKWESPELLLLLICDKNDLSCKPLTMTGINCNMAVHWNNKVVLFILFMMETTRFCLKITWSDTLSIQCSYINTFIGIVMVASIKHNVSHIQHCHDSFDTLKNIIWQSTN